MCGGDARRPGIGLKASFVVPLEEPEHISHLVPQSQLPTTDLCPDGGFDRTRTFDPFPGDAPLPGEHRPPLPLRPTTRVRTVSGPEDQLWVPRCHPQGQGVRCLPSASARGRRLSDPLETLLYLRWP